MCGPTRRRRAAGDGLPRRALGLRVSGSGEIDIGQPQGNPIVSRGVLGYEHASSFGGGERKRVMARSWAERSEATPPAC